MVYYGHMSGEMSDLRKRKQFNTAGTCFPELHYMVDVTERLERIRSLFGRGEYFCINRGRQYGKTTTLEALSGFLKDEYTVFQISLEGFEDSMYADLESVLAGFMRQLALRVEFQEGLPLSEAVREMFAEADFGARERYSVRDFKLFVARMCKANGRPVVVLIDEVDQAGNFDSFVKFLGTLRNMYLDRAKMPTFRSVVLAGVYDVRNLKLKIRSEDERQYNSPWNIAVPFTEDMSLSEQGIAGMLADYESDNRTGMDVAAIAKLLRDYTSGYPFLVSRLCQLMDGNGDWTNEGFQTAVRTLLHESNTLFDDLMKKLFQFPELMEIFRAILYRGKAISCNYSDPDMALATRFSFIREGEGPVRIHNRIFETYLYNYFVTQAEKQDVLSDRAAESQSIFVRTDGTLDMPLVLERFVATFNEIYGGRGEKFLEEEGRRYFMLYVKPIINGTGNYYIEPETRDALRSDMIIDYRGHRYVIEMKIWRGEAYNERGERQLAEYLDRFDVDVGYMVSFCFNRNKVPGLKAPVRIGSRTLVEAVV